MQVADDAEAAAVAHEAHDAARRGLPLFPVAPLAEEAAWIEQFAHLAQVGIHVGVLDGAIDRRRVVAGERERPDRQLPIAHVQGNADGGAQLVLVSAVDVLAHDLDTRGVGKDAVDLHGLGHDPAQVLPHGERNGLALLRCLLRKGDRQVVQRALMAAIEARDEPPGLGRDLDADIDRDDAHQCHD